MARIIDGRARAARVRALVAERVARLRARTGVTPTLAVVLVGEDPASRVYVRTKTRMAEEVGITSRLLELPADIPEAELLARLEALSADEEVHGILVQLPLPAHIDPERVLFAIDPAKDVDGFHPLNVGRLWTARDPLADDLLVPCTPRGCLLLIEEVLGRAGIAGRQALVLGRSNIVGKPMAALLLARHATVILAHSRTRDLPARCREAEILVVAVGRPGLVRGDWVREGAVVIDVGINRLETAAGRPRLVGDVAFDEVAARARAITPVPGGVGPMTVAMLLYNTWIAARRQLEGNGGE